MKTIIKLLPILIVLGCSPKGTTVTNPTTEVNGIPLSEEYISKKTTYFTINQGKIEGDGLAVWKELIATSQFLMLGERHNSEATSQLVNALLPILDTTGYKHFAVEVGPHSAKKLATLSTPVEDTQKNLTAFIEKYAGNEEYAVPIPFFGAVSDAAFLQTTRNLGMELWGLDQEYFHATEYFMDDLLAFEINSSEYKNLEAANKEVKAVIKKWSEIDADESVEIDFFKEIQNDSIVQEYLANFRKKADTNQIIKDLEISWDIYSRWRNDSHADRISYMRTNFMTHYIKALEKEKEPKVLLKFGGLHASKILTNNCYDLGDLITQIAAQNGTQATILNSWHRYYIDSDGNEVDYLEKYPNYYNRLRFFMGLAKKDQWTLIDLKSIRDDIKNGNVTLPTDGDYHRIRSLIDGYDYQLILPIDRQSEGLIKK